MLQLCASHMSHEGYSSCMQHVGIIMIVMSCTFHVHVARSCHMPGIFILGEFFFRATDNGKWLHLFTCPTVYISTPFFAVGLGLPKLQQLVVKVGG